MSSNVYCWLPNLNENGRIQVDGSDTTDKLMRPDEVSEFLNVPVSRLYQWKARRYGPTAIVVGRGLRYRRSDVESFLEQQSVR